MLSVWRRRLTRGARVAIPIGAHADSIVEGSSRRCDGRATAASPSQRGDHQNGSIFSALQDTHPVGRDEALLSWYWRDVADTTAIFAPSSARLISRTGRIGLDPCKTSDRYRSRQFGRRTTCA